MPNLEAYRAFSILDLAENGSMPKPEKASVHTATISLAAMRSLLIFAIMPTI